MSCGETSRLLDAYVDGELDLTAALAVEDHVRACSRCTASLARMNGLRAALRSHAPLEPAPRGLQMRLQAVLAPPSRSAALGRAWALALAAPGCIALALVLWLGFVAPARGPAQPRVVYHISSSAAPAAALRNVANHLNASPDVKIVVVAHNEGVDFLLRGARDESGQLVEPALRRFLERGVDFRICYNTLERRRIDAAEAIPEARLVPSGIAEISRLQSQEGYAYMRL